MEEIKNYFKQEWLELKDGQHDVYAFTVTIKNNNKYVGILTEQDGHPQVYRLRGSHKLRFLGLDANREILPIFGFVIIPYKNDMGRTWDIIYLPGQKPFASFTVDGNTRFWKHTFPNIKEFEYNTEVFTKDNGK